MIDQINSLLEGESILIYNDFEVEMGISDLVDLDQMREKSEVN